MLDVVELCHWFSYHWQIIQSWWLDYSLSFFCIASNIGILQLFKWGWEWIDNEKMFVIVFADIFIFPYLQSQIVSKRSRLCEFHRWPKSADDDAAPPVFAFADQLSHPLSQIQIFMPNTNTNEDANTIVNAIGNGRWPQNLKSSISQQPQDGSYSNFKLKFIGLNQRIQRIQRCQMKMTSNRRWPKMEDDLKLWEIEYLSNHWSDFPQILNLSIGDQTKIKNALN